MKRRVAILAGVVLAVFIGAFFIHSGGGPKRELAAYKQQLLARGEKLAIAETTPRPSTKTPNAASNFMAFPNGLGTLPGFPPVMLTRFPPMMVMVGMGTALPGTTNIAPEMMVAYKSNARQMAELRSALAAAVMDFNLDYSHSYALLLPHLSKLKKTEVLATGSAMEAMSGGDYSEAWQDLYAAVDLFRLQSNEPIMITDLVRAAEARLAVAATWEALQCHSWTEEQLSGLQSKWSDVDLFSGSEATLSVERAFHATTLDQFRHTNSALAIYAVTISPPLPPNRSDSLRDKLKKYYDLYPGFWRWKSHWSYAEELYGLQILTAAIDASRKIKNTGAFVPAFNDLDLQFTNITKLNADATGHFLISPAPVIYHNYLLKLAEAETWRRLTVTAIAQKRYQLEHGAYPASLNELVPRYLPAPMVDLMDGKPLRYRLRADGDFLLYSVGDDGQDDGGTRDIVWPRPASVAEAEAYYHNSKPATNAAGK